MCGRISNHEPPVPVGRMVHDEVEQDANPVLLRVLDQAVEVPECAVHGIRCPVVGHVVAEIDLRRGKAWRDPQCIHAKIAQVIELGR